MKQEHRFVADLYRYLAPFIDPEKPIYLSLDGEAAKKGVTENRFQDADIPDLWFSLVGDEHVMLIEAKMLFGSNSVKLNRGQLMAWRTNGTGKHKPTGWVAATHDLRGYFFWFHYSFQQKLDLCQSKVEYPEIRLPDEKVAFNDIRTLALHILRCSVGRA